MGAYLVLNGWTRKYRFESDMLITSKQSKSQMHRKDGTVKSYFKRMTIENKFDRKYACFLNNHCGIGKLKRYNRKLARNRLRQQLKKEETA